MEDHLLPLVRPFLSFCLLQIQDTAFLGQSVRPSIDSIIRRFVKADARVVYHARRWYVYIASAFPLTPVLPIILYFDRSCHYIHKATPEAVYCIRTYLLLNWRLYNETETLFQIVIL